MLDYNWFWYIQTKLILRLWFLKPKTIHDFSVLLRTGSNPGDNNLLRSLTRIFLFGGKIDFFSGVITMFLNLLKLLLHIIIYIFFHIHIFIFEYLLSITAKNNFFIRQVKKVFKDCCFFSFGKLVLCISCFSYTDEAAAHDILNL